MDLSGSGTWLRYFRRDSSCDETVIKYIVQLNPGNPFHTVRDLLYPVIPCNRNEI